MIDRPMVLVLGAGASAPYGFPSGAGLANRVIESFRGAPQDSMVRCVARVHGIEDQLIADVCRLFNYAPRASLDVFLESRPEFETLAKYGMAAELLPCEKLDLLIKPIEAPKQFEYSDWWDWYEYFFRHVLPVKKEHLKPGHLRIITFNFDRSFEMRAHVAVSALYDLDARATQDLMSESVQVLHVHGSLGETPWATGCVPYGSTSTNYELAFSIASQIHIVSNKIPDSTLAQAHSWLREARVIYFMGFGYDRGNLLKLGAPDTLKNDVKDFVGGTRIGISDAELTRARPLLGDFNWHSDIRDLLRNRQWIHF